MDVTGTTGLGGKMKRVTLSVPQVRNGNQEISGNIIKIN